MIDSKPSKTNMLEVRSYSWSQAEKSKNDQCRAALFSMLAFMAHTKETEFDAAASREMYRRDLEDLPVEDLIQCFNDWRTGRYRRPDSKPTDVSFCPRIDECRGLVENRVAKRLADARRYSATANEITKSAALRERLANRTPDDIARVKLVQDMLSGVKIADARFVMGPLGPHPLNGWTYEQLDDESVIINGREELYTMRPVNPHYPHRDYGYLTVREAAARHSGQSPP